MTQRLFLSTVTDEYGPDRLWLAERLRPAGLTVVHQGEFVETGTTTLVSLARMIEHESDIILHLVGSKVGSLPTSVERADLFAHCGEDQLRKQFPRLFEHDTYLRVTYTEWEAWLGKFYGKRVIPCVRGLPGGGGGDRFQPHADH